MSNLKTLLPSWLTSLINLIQEKQFEESAELANYYPPTPLRNFVQFIALAQHGEFPKAYKLLEKISIEALKKESQFTNVLESLESNFTDLCLKAIRNNHTLISDFCLDLSFSIYISSPTKERANRTLLIGAEVLDIPDISLGIKCFRTILNQDSSPHTCIKVAEIALNHRNSSTKNALEEFAFNLIEQVLEDIHEIEIKLCLKIAKLLAIESHTFDKAANVLLTIADKPEAKSKASAILLPLLEYKSYFGEIVDALIKIDPANIVPSTKSLLVKYERTKNQEYLKKVESLLAEPDKWRNEYPNDFASSVIFAASQNEKFEPNLKQLLDWEISPHSFLTAANVLIKKSASNLLAQSFIKKAIGLDPDLRVEVIRYYLSWSQLSSGSISQRQFLIEAVNLSDSLDELFELSSKSREYYYGDLILQLFLLFINKDNVSIKSNWLNQNEFQNISLSIIERASPQSRFNIFYHLLENQSQISLNQLSDFLDFLLKFDLKPTNYFHLERIDNLIFTLPKNLQNVITKKFAVIRKELIKLESHHSMKFKSKSRFSGISHSLINLSSESINFIKEKRLMDFIESEKSDDYKPPILPPITDTEDRKDFERYTRIDLPAECLFEQRIDLKIQLTREKPEATRVISKIKTSLKSNIEIIEIDVQITAQNFAKQEIRQVLHVPTDKDSNEITFTLFPRELGNQLIEIEFFYEASRIGYVIVETNVKTAFQIQPMRSAVPTLTFASMEPSLKSEYSPASPIFMDNPASILEEIENISNKNKITLHVSWDEKAGQIFYTIYDNARTEIGEWKQPISDIKEYIRERLQELNAFLHEVVVQGNPSEEIWESICFQLESVGKSLFEDLVPLQVRDKSLKWKKETVLLISTNEQWIPWELIFDGTDFWGKEYILARIPRINESRPISERKKDGQIKNILSIKKIVNVIGGDIADVDATKAENLFNYLVPSVQLETLKKKPIASLKRALPDADILHLTCHGLMKPHILQIGNDKSQITNISPDSIRNLDFKPGLVVFANACSSTAPVLTFGKFNSFGWEFYRQGTEVFIGTLGAVPTKYAIPFAEFVYQELLQKKEPTVEKKPQSIGKAIATAKQVAEQQRNLFWLLYCIYGDPDFLLDPFDE